MRTTLIDLIDIKKLDSLFNAYTKLTNYAIGIVDYQSNEVIYSNKWQNICCNFYRKNSKTCNACSISNKELTKPLKALHDINIHHCKNGLIDGATPIIIDGECIATLFIGQVLFEKPYIEKFRKQAKTYGFDEEAFLEALARVPVVSEEKFRADMIYLSELAVLLAELGLSNKKLREKNLAYIEANRQKDTFLNYMSHELLTPLNAILGFTGILKKEYYGTLNQKQMEYAKVIHKKGEELFVLINNLLDINEINSNDAEMKFEIFLLENCIANITRLTNSLFNEKQITFIASIESNVNYIEADKKKLQQILLNLLHNAIKFTPRKGTVYLEVSKTDDNSVKIAIKDTGEGIKKEKLHNIFDNFFETEVACDKNLSGKGIGLALSKKLVEAHNGEIGVISSSGNGSIFWFTLPITQKSRSINID